MIIEKLKSLEEKSRERGIPIIGSEKGKWLLDKVKELQPQNILELGTANGYSGIILGSEGGKLVTIEIDAKIAEEAMQNFSEFEINGQIIIGDGVKIVGELQGSFDLIFIDFAKKKYIDILEDCLRLLKENGVLIADNISMEKCQNFKEAVLHDSRLKTEIIEIGDGLSISKKL
jgi:predicted O-methyltransferase YrrM